MRLVRILLLVIPALPILQLGQVWGEVGRAAFAPYVATLHGVLVVCWVNFALIIAGLLRPRPRAAERRVRIVLAVTGGVVALAGGVSAAILMGILRGPVPRWDTAIAVALPGIALSALVLLGWPGWGAGWRPTRRAPQVRPGRLVPGVVLAVVGAALGHLGDAVVWYRVVSSGRSRPDLELPAVVGHHWALPLGYGLVIAFGWLLICLAMQPGRARALTFVLAAGGLLWVAALTQSITGDGLALSWYGVAPLALLSGGVVSGRRRATVGTRTIAVGTGFVLAGRSPVAPASSRSRAPARTG